MALLNKPNKKRKSSSEIIFEVNEDDCSPTSSPEPVVNKIECTQITTEICNYNNLNDTFQINNDNLNENNTKNGTTEIGIQTTHLLEENINNQIGKKDKTNQKNCLFSISFYDENFAKKHKSKLLKTIMTLFDYEIRYEINENNLEINFIEEKVSSDMDIVDEDSNDGYRESKENLDNFFTVDTTPNTKNDLDSTPRFLPRYGPIEEKKEDTTDKNDIKFMTCFNCDGNHTLRECKEPKDYRRIQMARSNFAKNSSGKTVRYHLDEEQKYSHIVPGKISNKLREALDIKENELPNYIYQMRRLGYPPGWLQMAKITSSNITLFDFHGSTVTNNVTQATIDPTKIVEYLGFNIDGPFKDEYKKYGCPSFSKEHSKENMIAFIEKITRQIVENQSNINSKKVEDKKSDVQNEDSEMISNDVRSRKASSPTLNELELKKKQLLDMLQSSEPTTPGTPGTPVQNPENSSEIKTNFIKSSTFGTPIIKTNSPFEKLPNPDNFSKDISQVINFENLPNATGKYEQMSQVITKVRKTIKYGNENK